MSSGIQGNEGIPEVRGIRIDFTAAPLLGFHTIEHRRRLQSQGPQGIYPIPIYRVRFFGGTADTIDAGEDIGYLKPDHFTVLYDLADDIGKMLWKMIDSLKDHS
jgi:hypothetical protein